MTWLLGHKLITVTTSGCTNKAMRGGLCDNCWVVCKAAPPTPEHSKSSQSGLWRASSSEGSKEDKLSRQSSGGHGSSNANTATNSPTEEVKKPLEEIDATKREVPTEVPEKDQSEPSKLEQILNSEKQEEYDPCACWCQGWAEIYVRRPTGDMSWIMRIQNSMNLENSPDFPIHDITSLYMPTNDMILQRNQDFTIELLGDELEVIFKSLKHINIKNTSRTNYFIYLQQDVPDAVVDQSQSDYQNNSMKSITTSSASSGPIAIPGSPARPSPTRQSSRDSLESLEEGEEGIPCTVLS